jgi:predicted PurR-regulated permease PerM
MRLISEVLCSVKLANPVKADNSNESQFADLKKDWMLNFLRHGGFDFSYSLFFKFQNSSNSFSKNFYQFILKILVIFITASFMARDPEKMEEMI